MRWYKALKFYHLGIGIWGCRLFTMPGPDFAGKQRFFLFFLFFFFYSLDVSANLFVVFPDSIQIAQIPPDSNIQDSCTSFNSHYVSILCSYLFMPERKKSSANQQKEKNHVYKGIYCVFDCTLKKIVQKHMVTALIASFSSVNIL